MHGVIESSYDGKGRRLGTAQRMDPASFGGLSDACTLSAAGVFGPDRITRTQYDAADRLLSLEVAVGTADAAFEARATYTGNGRLATLTDAAATCTAPARASRRCGRGHEDEQPPLPSHREAAVFFATSSKNGNGVTIGASYARASSSRKARQSRSSRKRSFLRSFLACSSGSLLAACST